MRFTPLVVLSLLGMAMASPAIYSVRDVDSTDSSDAISASEIALIQLTAQACHDCKLSDVLSDAECAVSHIGTSPSDVVGIVGCFVNGAKGLCDCLSCAAKLAPKKLKDWVHDHDVCKHL
ncbi:hypothetical protein EG329_013895 [Mollisiaceae sp. DMI_Dod_QoI]|nr:hypothetical protein EG329_013895 [Helotiales sp. DMI_Dod_QoI]